MDDAGSRIAERARELAGAIEARDLQAVRQLCTAEHWERSAEAEYGELLLHVERVELLGVLGRRDLMRLETPGGRYERSVFEHLWHDGAPPLVDDQRQFTVINRAEVEAAGDPARLTRLATKLDAQDAAVRYAEALVRHDEAAAAAMFEPSFLRQASAELHQRVGVVSRAELIGSVGPRTLVRIVHDHEQTIEYLWRRTADGLRIAGARVFERD